MDSIIEKVSKLKSVLSETKKLMTSYKALKEKYKHNQISKFTYVEIDDTNCEEENKFILENMNVNFITIIDITLNNIVNNLITNREIIRKLSSEVMNEYNSILGDDIKDDNAVEKKEVDVKDAIYHPKSDNQ